MEAKLYYKDPYQQSFNAQILKQVQDEAGNWYVVLTQTAFYPTGGGQPHDTGSIEGIKVIDVEEVDGEIRHYLKRPLETEDQQISASIDWKRRFDHMQQHAGQHILSAAFDNLFQYKTVSFHLGKETVTIDIDTDHLTKEKAMEAEELANRMILENRSIETRWVDAEELSGLPLRKAVKVSEDIRLVIIPDFDYNGCGGTHPRATGEVRAIKILHWERQKKNIRVQFVCGERVLEQLGKKQNVLQGLTKLLNAPELDLEQAVVRLLDSEKMIERELEQAKDALLRYEARELAENNQTETIGVVFQGRSIQELQKLAKYITTEKDNTMAFLVSENQGRLQLVCARGSERTENMKEIIGNALSLINGKGGGNLSFAQGGGDTAISGHEMLQYLQRLTK